APCPGVRGPAIPNPDEASRFSKDAVSIESFDNHCGRVPAPGMEPVGETTNGVPTEKTEEPPYPNDDPASLGQVTNLPAVHAVTHQLKNAPGVAGRLTTGGATTGAERTDRRTGR